MSQSDGSQLALITGAAGELGQAVALELAGRGSWVLMLCDAPGQEEALGELAETICRRGGQARTDVLDVRDSDDWERVRSRLQADYDHLDLLANVAGVVASGRVDEVDPETWKWVLDTNLTGTYLGCRTLIPWLKSHPDRAYILNVSSALGLLPLPRLSPYITSKAGVIALSETLRIELSRDNVSVTVLCPWFFGSNLARRGRLNSSLDGDFAESQTASSPLTPEGVAAAAVRATLRGRLYCVLGWKIRLIWRIRRMGPAFFGWVTEKLFHRFDKSEAADER